MLLVEEEPPAEEGVGTEEKEGEKEGETDVEKEVEGAWVVGTEKGAGEGGVEGRVDGANEGVKVEGEKEGRGVGLPGLYVGEEVGGAKEMVTRPLPVHTPCLLVRMLVHNVLLQ